MKLEKIILFFLISYAYICIAERNGECLNVDFDQTVSLVEKHILIFLV